MSKPIVAMQVSHSQHLHNDRPIMCWAGYKTTHSLTHSLWFQALGNEMLSSIVLICSDVFRQPRRCRILCRLYGRTVPALSSASSLHFSCWSCDSTTTNISLLVKSIASFSLHIFKNNDDRIMVIGNGYGTEGTRRRGHPTTNWWDCAEDNTKSFGLSREHVNVKYQCQK